MSESEGYCGCKTGATLSAFAREQGYPFVEYCPRCLLMLREPEPAPPIQTSCQHCEDRRPETICECRCHQFEAGRADLTAENT